MDSALYIVRLVIAAIEIKAKFTKSATTVVLHFAHSELLSEVAGRKKDWQLHTAPQVGGGGSISELLSLRRM